MSRWNPAILIFAYLVVASFPCDRQYSLKKKNFGWSIYGEPYFSTFLRVRVPDTWNFQPLSTFQLHSAKKLLKVDSFTPGNTDFCDFGKTAKVEEMGQMLHFVTFRFEKNVSLCNFFSKCKHFWHSPQQHFSRNIKLLIPGL